MGGSSCRARVPMGSFCRAMIVRRTALPRVQDPKQKGPLRAAGLWTDRSERQLEHVFNTRSALLIDGSRR